MDGGEISDDVRTITRRMGGKIGAKLGPQFIPFNPSIGANLERFISRQFKIRQHGPGKFDVRAHVILPGSV